MTKPRITTRIFLVLLLALATEASQLFGQVKSSAITGTVTDTSGAVVPNAAITVLEQQTNVTTTAQSNDKGEYTVPYLPIGLYTVTVTAPGFTTYRKTDINLASATSVRTDVPLAVGNTTTSIEVKANAIAIQTENATVSGAVSSETITNLANINGNTLYFATLESGVTASPQQLNSQALGVGYTDRRDMSAMRINGGELGSNDVQLDGTTIQGAAWHETAVLPNPDALSEVRVTTNNFTADIGMAQGVIFQTTKSGTNKFHGDLNFMIRNEDLNANSFSNNHQGIVRPRYRLLQGGGAIGGPVIIPKIYNGSNKLFFFASFLRLTHTTNNTVQATVPTALERQGDFSATQIKGNSGQGVPVTVYNPFSATVVPGSGGTLYQRSPYPGNKVTTPNQFGLKILQGYPMPNYSAPGGPALANGGGQDVYHTNNYRFAGPTPEVRNSFNGRIDLKLTSSQSIYVTGGISKGSNTPPNAWGTAAGDTWVNQAYPGGIIDSNPYGAIGDTIILSPTLVLDLHYGVTHINTQAQIIPAVGDPSKYGMPNFVAGAAPYPGVLPELGGIGSYTALNNNSYANKQEHQLNHTVNGSISKLLGSNALKFGAEYRVYLQNWKDVQLQAPTLSTTAVTGLYASASGANATGSIVNNQDLGFAPAGWVTGAEGWTMAAGTAPVLALASKYVAIHGQDSWRPAKKWLLTVGIRYEVQPGPTERFNRMTSYNLDAPNPFASGANGPGNLGLITFPGVAGYSRNLYETTWNNVSPRLGATYQLTDNTVLRGGYGRSYLPSNTGYNANGLIYGPTPFSAAVNPIPFGLSPAGVPVGTFDQPSNTYVVQPAGAVQSPSNYGTTGGVDTFNRYLYKTGHTDQWNFFIERQLSPTWLVNAGYVGSRSGLLPWRQYQLNGNWSVPATQLQAFRSAWIASNGVTDPATAQVPNPLPALVGHAAGASGGATITAIQSQMPYLAALGETNYESKGASQYHAFVAKVQHTTSHGLLLGANYTWSKATGTVGGANNQTYEENQETNSSGPTGGVDWVNMKNNHTLLNFDVSNRFVLNGSYALPFGKGKLFGSNAVANLFIGGWQVTSAVVLQSGNPWAPTCGSTLNGRCNQVPGQPLLLPKSQQRYYNGTESLTLPDGHIITPGTNVFMKWNPDAWTAPMITMANGKVFTDQYQNGTTPIALGFMRTAGVENVNLSVIKKFAITERVAADFHVNATNALNHHNPPTPNNTVTPNTATTGVNNAAPGQNTNVSFGSYGLGGLENRQLTIQANITF